MTTLMRRHAPLELSDWMSRFFDDRLLHERFGLPDKGMMRVEEHTDGDTLVVRAELPGIDPDKDVDKTGYRSEFRYGMFERTLPLPAGVTEADVTATYKDGILEIRLPRSSNTESATVPVVRLP